MNDLDLAFDRGKHCQKLLLVEDHAELLAVRRIEAELEATSGHRLEGMAGEVKGRFAPTDTPQSLEGAIEALL